MSGTAEVFLGIIAVAVAVMAIVQVGAIVAGLRVARRVEQLAHDMETSVKPLLANLTAMSAEASRAATVAAAQVQRIDRLFTDLAARDPWFILPVLMTLSSLFQVWLNPTPPDPVQAKMMWIMPLAFSVMF